MKKASSSVSESMARRHPGAGNYIEGCNMLEKLRDAVLIIFGLAVVMFVVAAVVTFLSDLSEGERGKRSVQKPQITQKQEIGTNAENIRKEIERHVINRCILTISRRQPELAAMADVDLLILSKFLMPDHFELLRESIEPTVQDMNTANRLAMYGVFYQKCINAPP